MSYLGPISSNNLQIVNYISNGKATDSGSSGLTGTTGWSTYAESDAVTFQDTGDTVTLNSHGLQNGNIVSFTSITSTTGITANTTYYVVNAAANTFQVASTSGGSALPLTTNGSGTMVRFVPKLASGGSPSVTFVRDTTSPLRGVADFNFVKDAANRMGQGVEYDFTIDNADLAKVLTITFDYEVVSGTYADGDIDIFIIQDPSGTPVVIQPTGYVLQSGTVGTKLKAIATFQTSNSATSYRLSLHVSSTSTSAYTLAIDNVVVGPQTVQYGAPVTDWQDYTPTITASTTNPTIGNSTLAGKWRRVGDSMQVQVTWILGSTGASGTGSYNFSLPSGFSVDTAKVSGGTTAAQNVLGQAFRNDAGTAFYTGNIYYQTATTVRVLSTADWSSTFPHAFGTNDSMALEFMVPILGWSSTVQMSNDTDTRVVAARYINNTTSTTSTTVPFNFATKVLDTHNAVTTGGNWRFTAPVPGIYRISATVFGSTQNSCNIYKNGASAATLFSINGTYVLSGSTLLELNSGDYIDLRTSASMTVGTGSPYEIAIERLSGPSAIAASETVACEYNTGAGGSVANLTDSVFIDFGTKISDTHGAVTGAGSGNNTTATNTWRFVAPISGRYQINAVMAVSLTSGVNYQIFASAYVNGVRKIIGTRLSGNTWGTLSVAPSINGVLQLNAGDYLSIGLYQESGANRNLQNVAVSNNVSIVRVGN
jgi:hypothetical protein